MTARESLDVSAKTVDEAIVAGLRQLNLARDQVDVEIINEGKKGLFGLGAEDAKVRLTPKESIPPAVPPAADIRSDEPSFAEISSSDEPVDEPISVDESEFDEVEPEDEDVPAVSTVTATDENLDVETLAKKHLETLLELMGIRAQVTTRIGDDLVDPGDEPPLVLDITGKDLGILIGRRSETLQAIQYMIRLVVSKETKSWQRIVVDVESYRARRRSSLQQMALRMAERVSSSGERVVMEAMSAYDRRIIHMTLRDHPDVLTKSVGRDANRKVTIIPK